MKQPPLQLRKQRDFGEKISATFQFLSIHAKPLAKSIFYIVVPFQVFVSFMNFYFFADLISSINNGNGQIDSIYFSENLKTTFATSSIGIFTYMLLSLVVFSYIKLVDEKYENIEPTNVWYEAKGHIFKSIATLLIAYILILLGILALIIPGIYISVAFMFLLPIIVFQNEEIGDSIGASFKLIRGNWWATFGLVFIMGIICQVIVGFVSVPSMVLAFFSISVEDSTYLFSIAQVITAIFSLFVYAILLISIAFQYFNLVEKTYGTGLIQAIENLGNFGTQTSEYEDEEDR